MPKPSPGKKPSMSERFERARAAAAPKLEKAAADASPKVEKAAQAAGTFLGTLTERAKEARKQFTEGYGEANADGPAKPADGGTGGPTDDKPAAGAQRPRPRPRPDK